MRERGIFESKDRLEGLTKRGKIFFSKLKVRFFKAFQTVQKSYKKLIFVFHCLTLRSVCLRGGSPRGGEAVYSNSTSLSSGPEKGLTLCFPKHSVTSFSHVAFEHFFLPCLVQLL